ncbi:MAG: HAD family phosphatase [Lutisporaceae bacterium]
MKNKISAVIFDMDGLMFDTEKMAFEGWKQAGKSAGFDITDEIILASIGRTKVDTEKIMKQHFGEAFPYTELRNQRVIYSQNYIKSNGMPIKLGLLKLLDFLNEKGIKTAVATSSDRIRTEENLKCCNILDKFDNIVCGEEVERGKPEPDIFLLAAKKLGFRPAECIVLEDSENGIKAAYKAGMRTIMIPDMITPTDDIKKLTHQIFESLEHVIGYIEGEII